MAQFVLNECGFFLRNNAPETKEIIIPKKSVVIKIMIDEAIEKASRKSRSPVGIGNSSTIKMPTMQHANAISL